MKPENLCEVFMKGTFHIEVKNRDASFKFDLVRNITVVRGNSGIGKTTLYDMISDYTRLGDKSGVNISSSRKCIALIDSEWKYKLENTKDSIVFIDEGCEYLATKEFASVIKSTNNYYVIFCRENLHYLPYSVEEIYEIKASGKFHTFKKLYKSTSRHLYYTDKSPKKIKYNLLVTEDSKSGYEFYSDYFKETDITCLSSQSNSAVYKLLKEHFGEKILVIADGAAFGSEIDRVLKIDAAGNIIVCLPESFEWLILKSGLINAENIQDILDNPSDHIESSEFFSWENFFEKYLIEKTTDTPFKYAKSKINPVYLNETNSEMIIREIL